MSSKAIPKVSDFVKAAPKEGSYFVKVYNHKGKFIGSAAVESNVDVISVKDIMEAKPK